MAELAHISGAKDKAGPSLLSKAPLTGAQLGMLVALASWAMLFGTFVLSLLLAKARVRVWPPIGSEPVPFMLPTLALVASLLSSWAFHKAYQKLRIENDIFAFKQGLWISTLLGFLFLSLQGLTWLELQKLDFRVAKGLYDSVVYSLIAFHAAHVIGGMGSLLWLLKRAYFPPTKLNGGYNSSNCVAPQLVGWFWHFLSIVWVVFYLLLVIL